MPPSSFFFDTCTNSLEKNGFEVFPAQNSVDAKHIFFGRVFPNISAKVVSWGDSVTLDSTGILPELFDNADLEVIKTFEEGVPWREIIQRRRLALLSDLFLTGSNAVTRCGRIVNLDMIGNRTGAISFGPKKVVLFIGRNKIVPDLEAAFARIKNIAAPQNAMRHKFDTPCAKTGKCHDCNSPQRICNTWSVIDKCFPRKRIKIILIDDALSL